MIMERKRIVAGNWKMNKTLPEAIELIKEILNKNTLDKSVEKIVFIPFTFLTEVKKMLSGREDFMLGAQNCHTHESGAFTGETSVLALASVGVQYVLIGHSERRFYFHETSLMLKEKLVVTLKNGLKPVYCVGEQLAERRQSQHFEVVSRQIQEVLADLSIEQLEKTVLAYEPVWAIGTGETATPAQAEEMHQHIRMTLSKLHGSAVAQKMPILYGGSCNATNAAELFACSNVDGGLIGGASLKSGDFSAIIDAAKLKVNSH